MLLTTYWTPQYLRKRHLLQRSGQPQGKKNQETTLSPATTLVLLLVQTVTKELQTIRETPGSLLREGDMILLREGKRHRPTGPTLPEDKTEPILNNKDETFPEETIRTPRVGIHHRTIEDVVSVLTDPLKRGETKTGTTAGGNTTLYRTIVVIA